LKKLRLIEKNSDCKLILTFDSKTILMTFISSILRNEFLENIYLLNSITWTNNYKNFGGNLVLNIFNDNKLINNFIISKNKYENIKLFCGIFKFFKIRNMEYGK
jgi:hypothetical protein